MYGGTVGNESIYVCMKQSDQKERREKNARTVFFSYIIQYYLEAISFY